MSRLASRNLEANAFRLLLAAQLRPSQDTQNLELAKLARKDQDNKVQDLNNEHRPGEFRIMPVTVTTVEGIGTMSNVHYAVMTFQVTDSGVQMEKRAVWGPEATCGFMTFNE